MKFDRSEQITGADLTPGAVLLSFFRARLTDVLEALERLKLQPDAFVIDRQRGTVALFPEGEEDLRRALLPLGAVTEGGYFRLLLRGHRLSDGRGLAGLWESVLAHHEIPLRLSCSDSTGITQYLPLTSRPAVLALLEQTFNIRVV